MGQVARLLEISVVRRMFPGVVPYSFGGVEFWPAGRQLEHLQIPPLRGKPLMGFLLFVIGNVVLNQEHSMTPPIKGREHDLLQKGHVSFGAKIFLLVSVDEW